MIGTFTRTRITWLAYLLLSLYGYFLNVFGPITPYLKDELHLSYTMSSLHFSAFAAGIILVGLTGHLVIRRLGTWRSLWLGAFGISLGAILLSAGRDARLTIGAAFLMGTLGSLILALVPSILDGQHREQRAVALSEANVVASLFSSAAPLLVGWFALAAGSWRLALGVVALAPLGLWLAFRQVENSLGSKKTEASLFTSNPGAGLPREYWWYWGALVFSVSIEFCMIFWSADFLEITYVLPKAQAAQAVSLFLGAMILGRLAGSRLVVRFAPMRVIYLSLLVAALGFLLFWKSGLPVTSATGLFLTGLGIASLYPLILSLAIGAAGDQSVQASARATLASGLAILALPLVLGRLADSLGIQPAYALVLCLILAAWGTVRIAARTPQGAVYSQPVQR